MIFLKILCNILVKSLKIHNERIAKIPLVSSFKILSKILTFILLKNRKYFPHNFRASLFELVIVPFLDVGSSTCIYLGTKTRRIEFKTALVDQLKDYLI